MYFLSNENAIDIYICSGRKASISTISVTNGKDVYYITPTTLAIDHRKISLTTEFIMYYFVMSGAIDKIKSVINDAVCYNGSVFSLVTYSDGPLQLMSVVTKDLYGSTMQCINSFFNQKYTFESVDKDTWVVKEYVTGMLSSYVKRSCKLKIKDERIIDLLTNDSYTFKIEKGNIVFRKTV